MKLSDRINISRHCLYCFGGASTFFTVKSYDLSQSSLFQWQTLAWQFSRFPGGGASNVVGASRERAHCAHWLILLWSWFRHRLQLYATKLAVWNIAIYDTVTFFYSASALLAMQSAVIARGIPSVRPSVDLSVTFRYCVQTNKDTIMRFSASGRTIPLVSGALKFIRIFAWDHPQQGC